MRFGIGRKSKMCIFALYLYGLISLIVMESKYGKCKLIVRHRADTSHGCSQQNKPTKHHALLRRSGIVAAPVSRTVSTRVDESIVVDGDRERAAYRRKACVHRRTKVDINSNLSQS